MPLLDVHLRQVDQLEHHDPERPVVPRGRAEVLVEPLAVAQEGGAVDRGREGLARLERQGVEHRRRDILADDARRASNLLQEELRYLRIELGAAALAQYLARLLGRPRLPVGT